MLMRKLGSRLRRTLGQRDSNRHLNLLDMIDMNLYR
jgi:hypothetical protein